MHGGAAIADGHPDEKGSSPETTPACSDRPSDSPSCPTNHSKADGSPEAASARSTAVDHVHNSLETSVVSSAESSTTANLDLPRADEAEKSDAGPADVKRGSSAEDPPGEAPTRENGQSGHGEDAGRQEQSENAQRIVASEGAELLPTVKINTDEGLLTADQRLVESLIAAAAGNTSADAEVENSIPVRAFALSDCTSSSTLNGGQGPSAEDKLAMATLLGLAGVPPQKSGEVTGSENGEDDDAASAQESSSRPADGSDGDDMDEDSKEANGHKDTKVSGRRGAKRKKEKDAAEGDDNEDDGENEDVEAGKAGRKSKQDDGDEVKPKGRKGKKQVRYSSDAQVSCAACNAAFICYLARLSRAYSQSLVTFH
jgi:hypothetical protein